jgi:alanine racemase
MLIKSPHTWLEISKAAFDHNIQTYRSLIGSDTALSVVAKSNAYGHGTKEIGILCQENAQVDWLCTASLSEALELRSYGITKPILVLSIIDKDPELALTHDIDFPVFDLETAQILNAIAQKTNRAFNVHIKIDTGLTRYGLAAETALDNIKAIHALPHIKARGIFTSCAESGNPDQTFTLQQLNTFNELCKTLEGQGIVIPFKHGANSAAASTVQAQFPLFNFVRLGAGVYGLWHFRDSVDNHPELSLKPVLSWKTRIGTIRNVPVGTCVSYDRTFITDRPTTIAIIPVGYQDGYDRRFSNKGVVRIHDYYARIIGRVAMNAALIEIPEGKTAHIGDEVILLGDYDKLQAHQLAALIESYNAREITTRLAPHIEKKIL